MGQPADDRQRQQKALSHWSDRKRAWDTLASKLAAKVGKTEGEVLHNTSHQWRAKLEELDYLNASIPQHLKSSVLGWEMTLRNQGDGIRYVKFGTSYPYPLYCPVRNNDYLPPDHNVFMKVISESSDKQQMSQTKSHTKSLKESEYYNSKETLYKKHILKRFPHKTHDFCDDRLMCVIGEPAPVTTERIEEDIQSPAQHYEFIEDEVPEGDTTKETPRTRISIADPPIQQPESQVQEANENASDPPHTGPLLLLASTRVLFHTEPNVLAHSPLKAVNLGSTAIFYGWKRIPNQPITNSQGEPIKTPLRPSQFVLAESHDGVLLPGEGRMFAFSFRSAVPCIASEKWELTTVPSGREVIVVNLRGVVTSRERDPLSTGFLSRALDKKMKSDMIGNIFLELLNEGPTTNVLDASDKAKLSQDQTSVSEEQILADEESRRLGFNKHNNGCGYQYNKYIYTDFETIWDSVQKLNGAAPSKWNGCVDDLFESASAISDPTFRSGYLAACHDLSEIASVSEDFSVAFQYADARGNSLPFYLHLACSQAIYGAVDAVVDMSFFLQEQLGMIESQKKASKKPAAKKAPPPTQQKTEEKPSSSYASEFEAGCRGIVMEMIFQVYTLCDNAAGRVSRLHEELAAREATSPDQQDPIPEEQDEVQPNLNPDSSPPEESG